MGGDPMGMLLRQRIVFLGGEVSAHSHPGEQECCLRIRLADVTFCIQVNDFNADAIISQLLLLDSTDPTKVRPATACHMS